MPSEKELRLLVLVANERTGREVAAVYKSEYGKPISYGTLYITFSRMKDAGWIDVREGVDQDGRLKYFKLTLPGRRAIAAATEHHTELARVGGLLKGLRTTLLQLRMLPNGRALDVH